VSLVQQKLRRAARECADKIYKEFREELLAEIRRATSYKSAILQANQPRDDAGRRGRAPTVFERVVLYLTEHPASTPKQILIDAKIGRSALYRTFAEGFALGVLARARTGGKTRYWVVGHESATSAPEADRAPPRSAAAVRPSPLREDVVAWIAAHPGCAKPDLMAAFPIPFGLLRRALEDARLERRIAMKGARSTARYFCGPVGAKKQTGPRRRARA
jgi:hypothetical protein